MTNPRSFLNDQSKDDIFRRRTECEGTHLTGRPIRRSVSEVIIEFQNCLSRFLSVVVVWDGEARSFHRNLILAERERDLDEITHEERIIDTRASIEKEGEHEKEEKGKGCPLIFSLLDE